MLKCEICGKEFKNKRALGSHMHYVHGEGVPHKDVEPKEPINLRDKLIEILKDVGVRKAVNTIVDIFFDFGGDDLRKLDELLRLAGVPSTSRKLVLERYGQLIGSEPPSIEETESDFMKIYEILSKRELQELLIEDLKTRIEERKKKLRLEDREEKITKREREEEKEDYKINFNLLCPCSYPIATPIVTPNGIQLYCSVKDRVCVHYSLVEVAVCRCGFEINVTYIPLGGPFKCPVCGSEYIKSNPGITKIVRNPVVPVGFQFI